MSKSRLGLALACAAAVFLAACEGLFTGARESIHPLTQQQDGGFAPVRITLDPEMNPIAFNLKGATLDSPSEAGRWNAYRATLLSDGAAVATGQFNVNNTGTDQMPQGGAFATTMLIASVPRAVPAVPPPNSALGLPGTAKPPVAGTSSPKAAPLPARIDTLPGAGGVKAEYRNSGRWIAEPGKPRSD